MERKVRAIWIKRARKFQWWKHYSKELKLAAVTAALSGEYSLIEVTLKYEISGLSVLQKWIKLYNGHRELKGTSKGRNQSMSKGRKTTVKDRIEIVTYCIKNLSKDRRGL